MTEARRSTPDRALRAVMVGQIAIALAVVALDLAPAARQAADPATFAPPGSGPATRPYRPDVRPGGTPGAPAMQPMPERLEFSADGTAVTLLGQIAEGDADRFAAYLQERRDAGARATLLRLDSSGGSVADALEIGRATRAAGMATEVAEGAVCLSACPYILAGGVERRVAEGGRVGVHQHYFGENSILPAFLAVEDVQRGQAAVMDYLDRMGVDPMLMRDALTTPPDEIFLLDAEALRDYRLVTTEDSGEAGAG
ncbi:COG3904 family protein [Frigidibacter oleivorans]|uniref:COG3904 family protein n=1 Tax=Frigidibacter oleivorans TaxID=2487129 RepID=UPI000F8CFCDF|nr:hypothetical protein [Frigidibacter oleivorans]